MRALAALLLLVGTSASAQTIYRWKDKKGVVHYTDDRSTIPAGAKLETTEGEELMVVHPAAPPPAKKKPVIPELIAARKQLRKKKQSGPVEVRLTEVKVPVSDADRLYIEESLRTAAASPRLLLWGGLSESVSVEITPPEEMRGYAGSDAFGLALGTDKMQLRAPRDVASGGFALDYSGAALHELAHLLEHQLAGQSRPAWFAEGFASVLADQKWPASIDDIAWWVIHEGGERPLDTLMSGRCNIYLAYAIATQAVSYLVQRVGPTGIKRMFELRFDGQTFDDAFSDVAGMDVGAFEARFIESLRPNYYERAR